MDIRIIAEVGSNHNCDFDRIKEIIKQSADAGCWAVKFQLFKADKLYAPEFVNQELIEKELPSTWIPDIKNECEKNNIIFGCTPFDLGAVDILSGYVDYFKISSFDARREDLIQKCISTGKRIMFSFGLMHKVEIVNIPRQLLKNDYNRSNTVFMHCVSNYPTLLEKACTGRVRSLHDHYMHIAEIGYSDHTGNFYAVLSAVINGARYLELHVDLDDGIGWESKHGHCWDMGEIRQLSGMIDEIKKAEINEFEVTDKDLLLRANPKTGLRENLL